MKVQIKGPKQETAYLVLYETSKVRDNEQGIPDSMSTWLQQVTIKCREKMCVRNSEEHRGAN